MTTPAKFNEFNNAEEPARPLLERLRARIQQGGAG